MVRCIARSFILSIGIIAIFNALGVPVITHFSWGKITVKHNDGSLHVYKDAEIVPTGSCEWDWNITHMRHKPGVQIVDVQKIITQADIIVLSLGVDGILHVPQYTVDYIKEANKTCYVELTPCAIELYNQLATAGKKVAGLFHSTC